MSLHFPLMVNGETIGLFSARRMKGDMEPDSINLYEIKVWTRKTPEGWSEEPDYEYTVHHRYGDGAWKLVLVAMGLLDIAIRKDHRGVPNMEDVIKAYFKEKH